LRKQFRVAYNPPRYLNSSYADNFIDSKGSELIGALNKDGRSPEPRRRGPKGNHEIGDHPIKFQALTSNGMTYVGYPRLPTPNKREHAVQTTGFGQFYGQTSYGNNFTDKLDSKYWEKIKEERKRVKEFGVAGQKGSLSPYRKLPTISTK
jgi:hypothetical protein